MKILLATQNSGKIRELSTALKAVGITSLAQKELGITEIPETAITFVENALLKARHACQQANLPTIADDSGLVVDALQGAPGIYSARYAGAQANAQDNIKKLLTELANNENRQAFYYCVLVYVSHPEDPAPLICEGLWQGSILEQPVGDQGFGYDPIFYVPSENKSAAQLSLELKNRISHRGQALRLLLKKLPEKLCQHSMSKI